MTDYGCITGLGVVSPAGGDALALWSRLLEGAVPAARRPRVRDGVPAPAAAHVLPAVLSGEERLDPRALRRVSELTRQIMVAAAACLEDAAWNGEPRRDTGLCIGTCFGSSAYHLEYHEALRRRGVRGASALLFTQSVFNAPPGHTAQVLGLRGSNVTLVGGESAGLEAVLRGARRVAAGAEVASLAGGGEQYADLVHASLHQSGMVGDGNDAPLLSEGSALLLIESRASAATRGVARYATVRGLGHGRGDGALARAARAACCEADLRPSQVDLVLCVPPATRAAEHLAAAEALGSRWLSAPTLALGAGFAGTSALGAALGALALRHGVVPPTLGAPSPAAGWSPSPRWPREPRSERLRSVLVLAATSRGGAAALLLGPGNA